MSVLALPLALPTFPLRQGPPRPRGSQPGPFTGLLGPRADGRGLVWPHSCPLGLPGCHFHRLSPGTSKPPAPRRVRTVPLLQDWLQRRNAYWPDTSVSHRSDKLLPSDSSQKHASSLLSFQNSEAKEGVCSSMSATAPHPHPAHLEPWWPGRQVARSVLQAKARGLWLRKWTRPPPASPP